MIDRELLELAAKAAGLDGGYVFCAGGKKGTGLPYDIDGFQLVGGSMWNPLRSDGDALRLAAKLKIDIDWQSTKSFPEPMVEAYRSNADEGMFCATESETDYRRAIVRAAAEIGRAA